MIEYQGQMLNGGKLIQTFPARTYDCLELAEERAMGIAKNFRGLNSFIDFRDERMLIIDYFEKPDEIVLRRVFKGERADLLAILNSLIRYKSTLRPPNQKPPL